MRWGITNSMSNFSIDICNEEIRRCNETSFGPSFVVNIFIYFIFVIIVVFAYIQG